MKRKQKQKYQTEIRPQSFIAFSLEVNTHNLVSRGNEVQK